MTVMNNNGEYEAVSDAYARVADPDVLVVSVHISKLLRLVS